MRWHRRLGPWPLYLLVAHAVLITVGYAQAAHDGVAAPVRASCCGRTRASWPRPSAFVAADRGRRHVLPARAPADGLRDVVVGASLHVPRAVPRRSRIRSHTGASFVGHPVATRVVDGAVDRRRSRSSLACRVGAAALALAAPPGDRRRRRAGGPGHLLGRAPRAPPAPPARSPAASSCSGASCAAGCGGRRTRTRSRPRRRRRGCGSRSRTSATTAPRSPRCDPARASRSKGPTASFTADTRRERPRAAGRRRRRHHADPRAARGAARGASTSSSSCARRAARTSSCATRSPSSSRAAAARCTSWSARASASASTPPRSPRSPPTRDRDVYVCGPDGFTAAVDRRRARRRRPRDRIHHESFAF